MLADLGLVFGAAHQIAREGHEGNDRLAGELVRLRHDGRLGDLLVGDDRRLHLGGREPVSGNVDHIVDPPDDPQVAVLVADRRVTDEVDRGPEARPIGLDVAVVVAIEGAEHRRPRAREDQQPLALLDALARRLVEHVGGDRGQRVGRRAGLGLGQPGQRRDHDLTRLGLPPGVDDRAPLAADHHVVPEPGLGVDRLPDGAQQAQR